MSENTEMSEMNEITNMMEMTYMNEMIGYLQSSISVQFNTCRVSYQGFIYAEFNISRGQYLQSSISVRVQYLQSSVSAEINIHIVYYLQSSISAEFDDVSEVRRVQYLQRSIST
jgi:hypothetical protein